MKSIILQVIFGVFSAFVILHRFEDVVLRFAMYCFVMGWLGGAIAMWMWPITKRNQQDDE